MEIIGEYALPKIKLQYILKNISKTLEKERKKKYKLENSNDSDTDDNPYEDFIDSLFGTLEFLIEIIDKKLNKFISKTSKDLAIVYKYFLKDYLDETNQTHTDTYNSNIQGVPIEVLHT